MAEKTGQNRETSLVLALARGQSVRGAATAAGYSERQAHRKVADPQFRQKVSDMRTRLVDQTVGLLTDANVAAVKTLRSLLDGEPMSVRLSAAKAIVELSVKLRENVEFSERLEKLEQTVEQSKV